MVDRNTGRGFYFYTVHLDSGSQYSRLRSAALMGQHLNDRPRPDPILVTGDFNAGEDNPVILYMKGQAGLDLPTPATSTQIATAPPPGLLDTFRKLQAAATEVGTYHAFSGRRTGPKIDYVFASPGTAILKAAIIHDDLNGQYPSDHFPVSARVVLPTKTGTCVDRPASLR
jgi:endonuclease/exonuclease/phosphatase family metal-dependent hydrolase